MDDTVGMAFALVPFYLLGAYPTGYLVARSRGINILHAGSGNIGAANISRIIGWRAGLLTLCGDIVKGALAAAVARYLEIGPWFVAAAGVTAVSGHCFSIPGRLKGGKGVATSIGVIAVLSPETTAIVLAVFFPLFAWSRIVSLSSLAGLMSAPIASTFLSAPEPFTLAFMTIAFLVAIRHRTNLRRLIEGKEERFSIHRKD